MKDGTPPFRRFMLRVTHEEDVFRGHFSPWGYTAPITLTLFGAVAITFTHSEIVIDASIWAFRTAMCLSGLYFLLIPRTFRWTVDVANGTYEVASTRFWKRKITHERGSLSADAHVDVVKADCMWPNWDLLLILPNQTVLLGRSHTVEGSSPQRQLLETAAMINSQLTSPPTA